ncbi:MAG: VCBS repeat-containing protein [Acidobacteria bacterium]|nr:VCBS repeat-containing protein [Acidobacteriota bacterium]
MKKLCLIALILTLLLFASIHSQLNNAQTMISTIIVKSVATKGFELAIPADYIQQDRLTVTPSNGFGSGPVAVSGNTAVIYSGVGFYLYVRAGNVWSQQALLVPSDGASVPSLFPTVGIEGDTIVIGGSGATVNSNLNQGAAYVFVRNGTTWTEQQRLTASDGAAGNRFGCSVAISGESIIVGANGATVNGNSGQGASYVFVRSGSSWSQQTKLIADDGGANNNFGLRVAINGDSAVVTRGYRTSAAIVNPAAYVFVRNGPTWSQQQKLSVCEPSGNGGIQCDFGTSISIDGDNLAVGNFFLNVGNNNAQGGVYVFTRSGTSWSQQQRLTANDGGTDGLFGSAVSIENDTLLVSARADLGVPGSAYIFNRTGAVWSQQQKLQVNVTRDSFGQYASMSGNTLLIASPVDNGTPGNFVGAVYVFTDGSVAPTIRSPFDFDGDSKTDISIFRPTGANGAEWWWSRSSDGGNGAVTFGAGTDAIVPGDYTGDGKADIAVWRPSNGNWFVLRSEDSSFFAFPFGTSGDVPVPADFDGDAKTDAAVFRPSDVTWYISRSSGGTTIAAFGLAGDKPVPADYDGDGKADIAIFRPNGTSGAEWWLQRSTNSTVFAAQFGAATDKAVVGDYTGDSKSDIAIWRPADGNWYVLRSEDQSYYAFPFGTNGDLPTPGDFDGDGKIDAAVFRPSNSTWYAQRSTAGTLIQQFGASGDLPVPNAYVR